MKFGPEKIYMRMSGNFSSQTSDCLIKGFLDLSVDLLSFLKPRVLVLSTGIFVSMVIRKYISGDYYGSQENCCWLYRRVQTSFELW